MFRQSFSDISQTVKQALQNIGNHSGLKDFDEVKDLDLTHALKTVVSGADSNKLCDIKSIIGKVHTVFAGLKCDTCGEHARKACKSDQETQYRLYCKTHFHENGSNSEPHLDLCDRLRYCKIVLNELDTQLVQLQDKVDLFNAESADKDQAEQERIHGCIQQNLEELKVALADMTEKTLKADEGHAENVEASQDHKTGLECLMYVKDDCDKCRNIILNILSMIPETSDHIDSDKDTDIINDSGKQRLISEEANINLITCAIDDKHGINSQMVYISSQSLASIKEIEKKIKGFSKVVETCKQV